MARSKLLFGLLAAALPITGCWVVIGESFDGYSRRGDSGAGLDGSTLDGGTDADADVIPLPLGFSAEPHAVGTCLAKFTVANNVGYPTVQTPPGPVTIVPRAGDEKTDPFDTDKDPRCYKAEPALPYCLIFASTFEIADMGHLGAFGKRPLAIVTTGDIVLRDHSVLDVGAFNAPGAPGPGSHTDGSSSTFGGGGGNAEPGAPGCTDTGGPAITDVRWVGGGNGGATGAANPACRHGGGGGGAVQLVSLCGEIRMEGSANINATGGAGGTSSDNECPQGFGGGAGGTVWLQGADLVLDRANGSTVDVYGGGGAGGGCRNNSGLAWTPGTAEREDGGTGAMCVGSGATGGRGGAGGRYVTTVPPGLAGTPGTGEAACGGGSGGRGRIVINTPTADCANYPFLPITCLARKQ